MDSILLIILELLRILRTLLGDRLPIQREPEFAYYR